MSWRDFFYFSKGERRALILLLILITIGWLATIWNDYFYSRGDKDGQASAVLYPVCIYPPDTAIPSAAPAPVEASAPPVAVKPKERKSSSLASPSAARRPFYEKNTSYQKVEKYPKGTIVELNTADTASLKKIPGIGSAFSNRIVKYRNLLGGFSSVSQLSEVYGIDAERYEALKEWFCVNPGLIRRKRVNSLPQDSLSLHPYISYQQARIIKQLCRQKGKLTGWENLRLLEEFPDYDCKRLEPYLSFE